jgi:hypothetical protein
MNDAFTSRGGRDGARDETTARCAREGRSRDGSRLHNHSHRVAENQISYVCVIRSHTDTHVYAQEVGTHVHVLFYLLLINLKTFAK